MVHEHINLLEYDLRKNKKIRYCIHSFRLPRVLSVNMHSTDLQIQRYLLYNTINPNVFRYKGCENILYESTKNCAVMTNAKVY